MNVEIFLAQVANLPEDGVEFKGDKWGDLLDEKMPSWKELAADSANWDTLAQSKPKKNRDDLMIIIVNVGGLQLANHFVKSRDSEVRSGATKWFNNNLDQFTNFSSEGKNAIDNGEILSHIQQVWQHLDPRKRKEIISFAWDKAFQTWTKQIMGAFSLHFRGISSKEIQFVINQYAKGDYYDRHFDGFMRTQCSSMSSWQNNILEQVLNGCRAKEPRTLLLSPAAALSRPFQLPKINLEAVNPLKALLSCMQSSHDSVFLAHYEAVRARFLSLTTPMPTVLRPDHSIRATIPEEVKKWFKQKQALLAPGERLPRFPKIKISEEDPPAFRESPWLKQRYEEDGEVCLERVDVESLLGAYFWDKKQIVIWRKGVELCSRALRSDYGPYKGLPFEDLFLCVLVHELGHWFNAEAKVANGARWDPALLTLQVTRRHELPVHPDHTTPNASLPTVLKGDARSLSSRSYHEAWAQMFAWLYGQEVDPNVLAAFEALEKMQSTPYQAWRQLVNVRSSPDNGPYTLANLRWDQAYILKSLEWSRSLSSDETGDPLPATYADRNFPSTNMMEWLQTAPRC